MHKENSDKNLFTLSVNELLERKKKVISHYVNLECKREQLLVLIEKLASISSERTGLLSAEQGQNILSKLFSIGDQVKQAEKNRNKLEIEISQAKEQIECLDKVLRERKLPDKG